MKKPKLYFIAILSFLLATSLFAQHRHQHRHGWGENKKGLKIVTSFSDFASIANYIVKGKGYVQFISAGKGDLHRRFSRVGPFACLSDPELNCLMAFLTDPEAPVYIATPPARRVLNARGPTLPVTSVSAPSSTRFRPAWLPAPRPALALRELSCDVNSSVSVSTMMRYFARPKRGSTSLDKSGPLAVIAILIAAFSAVAVGALPGRVVRDDAKGTA